MKYRKEHDTMGEVNVPADKYWGAQTQRSYQNFPIGQGREPMPAEIIRALAILKSACAKANATLKPDKMTSDKANIICKVADEICSGTLDGNFPLVVWQTGSGTQSNMNINEVIAGRGNEIARCRNILSNDGTNDKLLHPNDDVNMSQSSNDTFPTAMNMAAVIAVEEQLLPAVESICGTLQQLMNDNQGVIKCGRTHLQDATPISFSQEISGWKYSLELDADCIRKAIEPLRALAIGGTAVGTGLNAPAGFGEAVAEHIAELTGHEFTSCPNKFHALSSKSEFVYAHGAIKALATDLMKIANDIRWMASGPRNGLGEITIPANEPGSSIMPGKVNPTQCEQVTMVAAQVLGNDTTIGFAASQGNFELNVFMPVIAYNFLQSVRLLSESITSFNERCVSGIKPNTEVMKEDLSQSLMLVTALSPHIGYENAARIAKYANEHNSTLKAAALELGLVSEEDFDKIVDPSKMI